MKASLDRVRRRLAAAIDPPASDDATTIERRADRLEHELADLRGHVAWLEERHHVLAQLVGAEHNRPFLAFRPPGHFYSPIPDMEDLRRRGLADPDLTARRAAGVEIDVDEQLARWRELAPLIDHDVLGSGDATSRYRQPNGSFDHMDAAIWCAVLRDLRPRRVVEVGSGWSSALLLDVAERHLDEVDITLIEPFPAHLDEILRPEDLEARVDLVARPVQDVAAETFAVLEPGDVLFIDSTHVVKARSDVVDLFTRVVPSLAPGVHVHVHDMFWPFEYPWPWTAEGRAWNELYLVHALLAESSSFRITFFNHWFAAHHDDLLDEAGLPGGGGSLWLERVG